MSYSEDILKLRKRVADAVSRGLISIENKDFLEGTLLQIMNDAEKNRQNCMIQAENLRRQAAVADGQAGAFASTVSIVYNVLNGLVAADERDELERSKETLDKFELTKEADVQPVTIPLVNKDELVKGTKKSTKKTNNQ